MEPLFDVRHFRAANGSVPYREWLEALDEQTAARIDVHVERMKNGNFGFSAPVGGGVRELKIDVGPGFRVYYLRDGPTLVLLLYGGDKSTQRRDIRRALAYADAHWSKR